MRARIWRAAAEVETALERLEIPEDVVHEVVKAAIGARNACTEHHPAGFGGIAAWAEGIRVLRDRLVPTGRWVAKNDGNLPTVVSAGDIAVTVSSGDALTGSADDEDAIPRTKYEKGRTVASAIDANQSAFAFVADAPPSPPRVTWIVLMHQTESECRYELSLPSSISEDGEITAWADRIVFEPIPIEPEPGKLTEDGDEVVVQVTRRR
jgi:hypothetical protein